MASYMKGVKTAALPSMSRGNHLTKSHGAGKPLQGLIFADLCSKCSMLVEKCDTSAWYMRVLDTTRFLSARPTRRMTLKVA